MPMQVRRIPGWTPDDALEHKAIKGQKKGVRRYQYANGTYTPAGNKRYRPKKSMLARVTGINFSEEGLMMVGVGAAAAGLVLASGVVSLPAIGTTAASLSGKSAVSALLANETFRNIVLPSIGAMSIANMVEKILDEELGHSDYLEHHGIKGQEWGVRHGPPYPLDKNYGGFKTKLTNINKTGKVTVKDMLEINDENCITIEERIRANRVNNCAKCCATLDLRIRGEKNIIAQGSINSINMSQIKKWYKNPEYKSHLQNEIDNDLSKLKDGTRMYFGIVAKGHMIFYIKEKGQNRFYDSQTRRVYNSFSDVKKAYNIPKDEIIETLRVDNTEVNKEAMKESNVFMEKAYGRTKKNS